ncbi:hypothetical protein ES703_19812 [subsurface metagenome]
MEEENKGRVESTREEFDLEKGVVPKEEGERLPAPWRYRHFVEGVAAEDIARSKVGADPSRMARVFYKKDQEGGTDQVHVVGSPDVVKEVAEGLESSNRELHTWYVGEAETVEEERAAVRPALEELARSIPVPIIQNPREFLERAFKLPLRAIRASDEGIKELEQALEGFSPGKQTREESEGKGES